MARWGALQAALLLGLSWSLVLGFQPGHRQWPSGSPRRRMTSSIAPKVDQAQQKVLRSGGGSEQWHLVWPKAEQASSSGALPQQQQGVRSIYSLSLVDGKGGSTLLNARLGHKTTGPVPRSSAPSMLVLEAPTGAVAADEGAVFSLVEECVRWYLDSGGRIGKLSLAAPAASEPLLRALSKMGFSSSDSALATSSPSSPFSLAQFYPSASVVLAADGRKLLQFVEARIKEVSPSQAQAQAQAQTRAAELYTLHDVAGRLYHDLGEPKSAIEPYTSALVANPASAGAFRNLGSAYQAVGNAQMAFASYQQAIQVDPTDALVYLKLAYFYEDFASKDWLDAADHAIRCYDYYLANVDCEDTAVLTRLGNLQVREHKSVEAIETYSRALRVDGGMANVWFNKAHAQVQIGDIGGARESLQQTLQLDPSIVAASHMLKALSPDEAQKVDRGDDKYVRELFDSYSASYDPHVKKLMYSAPRVIRQELAKIYRGRFTIDNAEETVPMNLPSERPGCTTIIPTIAINSTLEVLDLGCGTGLAGAWLKDYARLLVGVDLSEQMVAIARKKMLYQELSVMSILTYLQQSAGRAFDLVVAADVLSYVGDLQATMEQVVGAVRPGGHLVFTAEAVEGNKDAPEGGERDAKGFTLLKNGRFGYSRDYLDRLVASTLVPKGFSVVVNNEFSPRLDAGTAVPGYLYILERKA